MRVYARRKYSQKDIPVFIRQFVFHFYDFIEIFNYQLPGLIWSILGVNIINRNDFIELGCYTVDHSCAAAFRPFPAIGVGVINLPGGHCYHYYFSVPQDLVFMRIYPVFNRDFVDVHEVAAVAREVLEAHFEILRGWEEIARVRYTTGQLDYAALLRVQVEIAKLSDEIESTKESARVATAKLNAELDRDADAPIEAATEIDMHSVDTGPIEGGRGDLDALLVEFRQSNPAVEVAQRRVSQLELREVVARRSTWPELSLGIEYLETGPARMETAESGKDAVVLKVGASIPLGRSRNRAIREEAEARTEARRRDLVRTQRTEEASLLASAYAYRDADRRVSFLEQEQIPRIAQSIEVMEEQFAAGDAMLLELLDLQRTWLDAELQLDRARAERGERLAQVEASLGRELESKGETR